MSQPVEFEDPEARAERLAAEALRFAEQARQARERLKEIQMTINSSRSAMNKPRASQTEESPEIEKNDSVKPDPPQTPLDTIPAQLSPKEVVGTESLIDGEVEEDEEVEETETPVVEEEAAAKEESLPVSTYDVEGDVEAAPSMDGDAYYSVPQYIPPVASVDDPFGGAHDDFCGVMDALDICSIPEPERNQTGYGGVHVSPEDSIVATEEPAPVEEEAAAVDAVEEEATDAPVEEKQAVAQEDESPAEEEVQQQAEEEAPVEQEQEEEAIDAPVEEEQQEQEAEEESPVQEESPVAEEVDLAPQEETAETPVAEEEPAVEQSPSTVTKEEKSPEGDEKEVEETSQEKAVADRSLVDKLQATCGCTFWE